MGIGEYDGDAIIMNKIQTGSKKEVSDAFSALVRRYTKQLFYFLAQSGLTPDEQKDVASETWTRVWEKLPSFEYTGRPVYAWIKKIAGYVTLEHFRGRLLGLQSDGDVMEPSSHEYDVSDEQSDEELLSRITINDLHAKLLLILDEATPDFQKVIEAYFFDSLTTDEIMEKYGWSQTKTYTTKFRALQWIKKRLEVTVDAPTILGCLT